MPPAMTASATPHVYCCPGEDHSISRSIHLARLAAFYPKCRDCPQRGDAVPFVPAGVAFEPDPSPAASRRSLFTTEGVRGIYLNELTRSTAGAIAGALASLMWDEMPHAGVPVRPEAGSPSARSGATVVIAHDERPSSPDMVTGVGAALRHMGCQVIDIGLATRPCFWFAVEHLQAAAGVQVSGAGCDPAWTGLDFTLGGAVPCSRGGNLDRIRSRFDGGYSRPSRCPGSQRTFQAATAYEAGLWKHFHALRPLRIAFACSNRPVHDLTVRLFNKLACRLQHVPTPVRARNVHDPADPDCLRTADAVTSFQAHLGILIDDDGQRCAFFDERGQLISPRAVSRVLAENLLVDNRGCNVVLESSEPVPDEPVDGSAGSVLLETSAGPACSEDHALAKSISELGGRCVWVPQTSGAVAQVMRSDAILLAGGASGRYWFQETFPTCDALLTLAKVLQALSRSDARFSEVAEQVA